MQAVLPSVIFPAVLCCHSALLRVCSALFHVNGSVFRKALTKPSAVCRARPSSAFLSPKQSAPTFSRFSSQRNRFLRRNAAIHRIPADFAAYSPLPHGSSPPRNANPLLSDDVPKRTASGTVRSVPCSRHRRLRPQKSSAPALLGGTPRQFAEQRFFRQGAERFPLVSV